MGPFEAAIDGFQFKNNFTITAQNAADFIKLVRGEIIKAVVNRGVRKFKVSLSSIELDIPIPFFPDPSVALPGFIVDSVVDKVTLDLAAKLADLIIDPLEGNFGRCGGMAFAGYDFYLQGWPVVGFGATPPSNGELGNYIYDRLIDSLELNMRTFLDWLMDLYVMPVVSRVATGVLLTAASSLGGPIGTVIGAIFGGQADVFDLGGPKSILKRTKIEWSIIKSKLDEEAACPIGLIFGNTSNPFKQHQVLAVAYTDSGFGTGTLTIWDNNHPNKSVPLNLDFRGEELKESGHDKPIVGIFHEEYVPKQPPLGLKLA
jgi:hypothetical protein